MTTSETSFLATVPPTSVTTTSIITYSVTIRTTSTSLDFPSAVFIILPAPPFPPLPQLIPFLFRVCFQLIFQVIY